MKIIVCDDENAVVNRIAEIIKSSFPQHEIYTANSSSALIKLISPDICPSPDIVFMDIVLKNESGIEIGKLISERLPSTRIIFISGYQNKFSEIYFSVKSYGVLEKPISSERLCRYINEIDHEIAQSESMLVLGTKAVRAENIIYVETCRNKVKIKTVNGEFFVQEKLDDIESRFPVWFVRCHKSFLVNMRYITHHKGNEFTLANGEPIVISRARKNETEEKYFKFKGGML